MFRALAAALVLVMPLFSAEPAGKVMRPADGAWFSEGIVDIVASAPSGRLLLDGVGIEFDEPFPGVLHAKVEASAGNHVITLAWPDGKLDSRIFVGASAIAGFKEFVSHPPSTIKCENCHSLSRRGRFRFSGDCFGCHVKDTFAKVHSHEPHVLQSCGRCHNAHGSTSEKHLILAKELACKQCHN